MNLWFAAAFAFAVLGLPTAVLAQTEPQWNWTDATSLTLEGRGWKTPDLESPYHRLPAKARDVVRQPVWDLGTNSAGLCVRFVTNATAVRVKWNLSGSNLAMPHMPATGMSGIDLYVRERGRWTWVGNGRPSAVANDAALIENLPEAAREFALYLPLYNGVTSVAIGVPEPYSLKPAPSRRSPHKPVVFYGTSITQGGCASRPGMAYTSIIGRRLDIETINLGFSGNGRGEPEMARLLAEIDASVFVIDTLPNMHAVPVDERIRYILKALKQEHPYMPVILMEAAGNQNHYIRKDRRQPVHPGNVVLKKIYNDLAPEWEGRLFCIEGEKLVGTDREGTVDGVHPTDLGFARTADIVTPVIVKALKASNAR